MNLMQFYKFVLTFRVGLKLRKKKKLAHTQEHKAFNVVRLTSVSTKNI